MNGGESSADGTIANITVGGAAATSPVSGAIVRWHLLDAIGGPFSLRVLRPAGGPAYTAVGSSGPVVVATSGLETFSTSVPITAGDTIGLEVSKGSTVGYTPVATSSIESWVPSIVEGSTRPWTEGQGGSGIEVGFNAEVQPQPTVSLISPTSGPVGGGTAVAVAGTDFANVSGVKFGGLPATFSVGSEGQITAVSPAGGAGSVPISVTTVAGTTTSSQQFTYQAPTPTPAPAPTCTVPNLQGKKLKAAKKKIRAADCKVGKVGKKKGVTAKTGKVVHQSPKAGRVLGAGSQVKVKLG